MSRQGTVNDDDMVLCKLLWTKQREGKQKGFTIDAYILFIIYYIISTAGGF